MENAIANLLQLNENSEMTVGSAKTKFTYVSCIKIKGKPILPPLITEERRNELKKYKQKAIETELRLMKQKSKKFNQISSEVSSIVTLPPSRQSTPARPVSLNLHDKFPGKTYVLSKSRTEGSLDQYSDALTLESQTSSSHKSLKKLEKAFKTTLEQRLALEENISIKNKLNKYQQSPIIEEQLSEKVLDSECDSKSEIGRWSPLKVEPLNSLRIELPGKDFHETDENLDMSQDDSQNTPETVTESPNLMRQNSYTLLTPSPALLSFLEAKKTDESSHKIQSGRKTWDIIKAKKNWDASSRDECKSMNDDGSSDEIESFDKKSLSFLEDDFSTLENDGRTTDDNEYVGEISAGNESGTSPDSCGSKKIVSRRLKMKCKVKGTNARSLKSVPSPKANEKVPFKQDNSIATQGAPDFVPLDVKNELSELSNLLLEMKLNHERQKKELEEKQQSEMKKLESIFKKKEAELLNKVCGTPVKSKSVYSQISKLSASKEIHSGMLGDGNHNVGDNEKENSNEEHFMNQFVIRRRPNSAKDFHRQLYNYIGDCNRRAKSMDFNEGNQDTDLDVSFQDDFLQSINRDTIINNEHVVESDSISNFSSRSSTISSENRPDIMPAIMYRKFHEISSEEYAKYNQAATVITAAARGYLTRRLLRTAHVQSLITTLKDAITCATQLHTASDIADSDIDLMRRLGRQIEAAWDAVYVVFFNTEISTKLQLISADRERLRAASAKTPSSNVKKKRISSATRKLLDRKKGNSIMSKSQTSNGSATRVRICSKMSASYPSPYLPKELK